MKFWSFGRFAKTVGFMALPMPALAVLSPQRALNRIMRRAAWRIAWPMRKAMVAPFRRRRRGVDEVMPPDQLATLRAWAERARHFVPGAATVERDIQEDAPATVVEADMKTALREIDDAEKRIQDSEP